MSQKAAWEVPLARSESLQCGLWPHFTTTDTAVQLGACQHGPETAQQYCDQETLSRGKAEEHAGALAWPALSTPDGHPGLGPSVLPPTRGPAQYNLRSSMQCGQRQSHG